MLDLVKGECMKTTKVGVEFVSSFTRKLLGDIVLENDEASLQAEYLAHDSGILFLRSFRNDNLTPKQAIELIAGCFEEGCNLQEILQDENVFEDYEKLEGIVMSVNNIPVLVTHYNHDSEKLYEEWDRQLRAEEKAWRESL